MKQFWTIFRFEFNRFVRMRSFRILSILAVIGVLLAMSYPRIAKWFDNDEAGMASDAGAGVEVTSVPAMRVAVAGMPGMAAQGTDAQVVTDGLRAQLPQFEWTAADLDEAALTEAVRAETYDAGLWLTSPLEYRYIASNAGMFDQNEALVAQALTDAYRIRGMEAEGIAPAQSAALALAQAQGQAVVVGRDLMVNYIYTYVLVMLLYMAVMIYGQLVASGVAAEKSSRAMELLITSAKPTSLMFGKVLGAGCAGVLQMGLILVAAFAGYRYNQSLWQDNMLMQAVFSMPLSIFAYALLFFVLGFFLYASLYGAMGSLVSRSEDVSTTTLPITMFFIMVFVIIIGSISSGNIENTTMKVLSFIPFTSPIAMFVRITMGTPTVMEIIISIALLVAASGLVGYISAAIYRIGVLLYGKPPKVGELYRAVRALR